MSQILETIYDAMWGGHRGEMGAEAVEAAKETVQEAEQHLTVEEFDNLWNAIMNIRQADDLDSFILGYRLGVQLTLEGLRPIQ